MDLEYVPYLKDHPTAEFELAEVLSVIGRGVLAVSFEGIEPVGWLMSDDIVRIAPRK